MDSLIPVLNAAQMRENDAFTLQQESISSLELMERVSNRLTNALKTHISQKDTLLILCGPGNNGGDGACIARMLLAANYNCQVAFCDFGKTPSPENRINRNLLHEYKPSNCTFPKTANDIDLISPNEVIDCLFGTGIEQEVTGEFLHLIQAVNQSGKKVISIDMPSGLKCVKSQDYESFVHPQIALTIQAPKPSFFFSENKILFEVIDASIAVPVVGLSYFLSADEPWKSGITNGLPKKPEFGNKGNSGHAFLVGGNKNMHGAICIAAKTCIAHGAGLTTVLSPAGSRLYMENVPEAMHIAKTINLQTANELDLEKYTVLAIGPGLNTSEHSLAFLEKTLTKWNKPVLLDADALNLIAKNPKLWNLVLPGSILTPHHNEFTRLFGETSNSEEKSQLAARISIEKGIYILAKDKYSTLHCPNAESYINGSGGPWLSKGGSGDTLTGAIAGWWAKTRNQKTAVLAAMYLCGFEKTPSFS